MPNSRDLRTFVSTQAEDFEWDAFVFNHTEPHHEQTSLWCVARSLSGWTPLRIIFRNGTQIVAGAQLLCRPIIPFCQIGYLARGPLIQHGVPADMVITEIQRCAHIHHVQYLAVSLPYYETSLVDVLLKNGFDRKPPQLPPCIRFQSSVILDLSKDVKQLFAECRSTTRKHIRRAQRSGMFVRMGQMSDLPLFRKLLEELCRRRHVTSNVPGGDFLDCLWRLYSAGDHIRLFLAQLQEEVVSALLVVVMGGWARAWRIGWAGRHPDKYPNELVYWESIKWAKENGCRYYDFVGIDPDDARAILNGRDASAPFKCSITFFKVGFGGQIILTPGEFCYFANPLIRWAFKCCGRQVAASRWFGRFASRIARG